MLSEKIDISYLRLSLEDDDVASGDTLESCSIGSQRLCIKEYVRSQVDMTPSTEAIDQYVSVNGGLLVQHLDTQIETITADMCATK